MKKKQTPAVAHTDTQVTDTAVLPVHRATLTRRDIMAFEKRLKALISRFVVFKSHSMHFPKKAEKSAAEWLADEKKVLLPLFDSHGAVLAIFVARGVTKKSIQGLLPHWRELSHLIVDNLLLHKQSLCDPVSGLYSRHSLLQGMEQELAVLSSPLWEQSSASSKETDAGSLNLPQPYSTGDGFFAAGREIVRRASFGILVVRFAAMRDIVREFGYQFADELMIVLADALQAVCPEQAPAAKIGDTEFAVHLPAATPKACRKLASELATALRAVFVEHPLRKERVYAAPSVGYALYPQDMAGGAFIRPVTEQARLLLRKARLAAALADELALAEPVMGFGRILAEGGRVLDVLPLSRVVVSLGASIHAREGQRFSVWSVSYPVQGDSTQEKGTRPPLYKGEIVLLEVHENTSQAEITYQGDPTWNIEPGDRLVLLPEEQGAPPRVQSTGSQHDPVTGLLRHGDFFATWVKEREQCNAFALALVRFTPPEPGAGTTDDDEHDEHNDRRTQPGQCVAEAAQFCREELGSHILGGRYGLNSFIFFHPDQEVDEVTDTYTKLADAMQKHLNVDVAVGIASYPYLEFRKVDTLDNCQKALEYATLLPVPHVGVLDSLALNISADKLFSQGDTFGAIKEYQLALMADENNGMAWNSLGICLAGLGRHAEAERHFDRALECKPEDAMAMYNMGYVHQLQGHDAEAEQWYRRCLEQSPDHLFALIRLGQLAEGKNDYTAARELYEQAAALPGGESVTCRHFARLCMNEGKLGEARELLHEALQHDAHDAFAMQLLAHLYLDAGEDPDLAASLARQSVSLRPGLKAGWIELARALEAMGELQQAREAWLKAGEM